MGSCDSHALPPSISEKREYRRAWASPSAAPASPRNSNSIAGTDAAMKNTTAAHARPRVVAPATPRAIRSMSSREGFLPAGTAKEYATRDANIPRASSGRARRHVATFFTAALGGASKRASSAVSPPPVPRAATSAARAGVSAAAIASMSVSIDSASTSTALSSTSDAPKVSLSDSGTGPASSVPRASPDPEAKCRATWPNPSEMMVASTNA